MTVPNGKWPALRLWLTGATLALIIAAFIILPGYAQKQQDQAIQTISCISARANVVQLQALQTLAMNQTNISRRLGLPLEPIEIKIPVLPEECR